MTTFQTFSDKKKLFCPSVMPQIEHECARLENRKSPRHHGMWVCKFPTSCRNAHCFKELYLEFPRPLDVVTTNLYQMRLDILFVISAARETIKRPYFLPQSTLEEMNFLELLNNMYNYKCTQCRIAKTLPSKHTRSSEKPVVGEGGYTFSEQVNKMNLPKDDEFWRIQRAFSVCPKYKQLLANSSTYIKDFCCGGPNCKFGQHRHQDVACYEDAMDGSCKCKANAAVIDTINSNIEILQQQLNPVSTDGFKVKMTQAVRAKILQAINKLDLELELIPKPFILHYTTLGMIPFMEYKRKATVEKVIVPKEIINISAPRIIEMLDLGDE